MAKNNLFMNWVSGKMVHEASKDGKTFYNLSLPLAASANGYGSISVSAGQVRDSTKKDGTVVPEFKNILLGSADGVRKVSIKAQDGSYTTVEMTNQEILNAVEENRKAYRAAKNTATADAEIAY